MATYGSNNGMGFQQQQLSGNNAYISQQQPQQGQMQFPYGNNNNMLLNNSPYNDYMGRAASGNSQNMLSSNQFLKCRPVSSKDEARAFQIDLDGSLWVFTDVGNGKIYTKQINNDGTATFKTYNFVEDEEPQYGNPNQYVTKEEFNKVIRDLMAGIQPTNVQESATVTNNDTSSSLLQFQ